MDTDGLMATTQAYLSPGPWNIGEGSGADAGQASSVALASDPGVQASCQKGRRTEGGSMEVPVGLTSAMRLLAIMRR